MVNLKSSCQQNWLHQFKTIQWNCISSIFYNHPLYSVIWCVFVNKSQHTKLFHYSMIHQAACFANLAKTFGNICGSTVLWYTVMAHGLSGVQQLFTYGGSVPICHIHTANMYTLSVADWYNLAWRIGNSCLQHHLLRFLKDQTLYKGHSSRPVCLSICDHCRRPLADK